MRKIANTAELQSELREILAYAQSGRPSRAVAARRIYALSERVAETNEDASRSAMKKAVAKLVRDAAKDLQKFVDSLPDGFEGSTSTSLESPPPRGGYGPFETGSVSLGRFEAKIVGDCSKGTIGIGGWSGPHALESLMTGQLAPKEAPARLKKILTWFKAQVTKDAAEYAKQRQRAPTKPSSEDVLRQLKRMHLGPAGRVLRVDQESPSEWSVEPQERQRLDHHGNDGEGWDEDSWQRDYAGPTSKAAQKWLDDEFGAGNFQVDIGDKGHVYVSLTPNGKKHFE